MRTKLRPFDIVFNPSDQPGCQTRYGSSLDRFTGGANIVGPRERMDTVLMDKGNLRNKFASGQVPQLLPSYYEKVRLKASK